MARKQVLCLMLVLATGSLLLSDAFAQEFILPRVPSSENAEFGGYLNFQEGAIFPHAIIRWGTGDAAIGLKIGGIITDSEIIFISSRGKTRVLHSQETDLVVGMDLWTQLHRADRDLPLDMALGGGFQLISPEDIQITRIIVGVSLGRRFGRHPTAMPYFLPALEINRIAGDTDINSFVEFGINLGFSPNTDFRFGVQLGGLFGDSFGIGLVWH